MEWQQHAPKDLTGLGRAPSWHGSMREVGKEPDIQGDSKAQSLVY